MNNTDMYVPMWDAFAKRKATAYLTDKYALNNIVGLVGMAREYQILRLLDLKKDDELIDVGCASGHQVFAAAPIVKRAVGVDVAKDFIDAGKKFAAEHQIKNVEFEVVDGFHFPYPDASFTKAICSEVIEHLIDPKPLLDEIKRVLKPGGVIVFTVPNWNSRGTVWQRMKHGFKEPPFTPITEFSMEAMGGHGDAHVRQFSIRTFSQLIRENGLVPNYAGGAGYTDGPYIGRIIELTNRLGFFRWLTFTTEQIQSALPPLKALSRHIVLRAVRP